MASWCLARWRVWVIALAGLVLPGLMQAGLVQAGPQRVALVVGNGAYAHVPGLTTATHDAQDVASRLRDLGFEVTLLTDIGSEVFWVVLDTFAEQARTADTVVFYYAGHAFQRGGVNHLVPVGVQAEAAEALVAGSWRLDDIAARLKAGPGQVLIFLDACRSSPLPQALRAEAADGEGLAQFDGGAGTFVAFATRPGAVAFDRPLSGAARNSPFTAALLAKMGTPGQSISDVMIGVRNAVDYATNGQQVPWDQSSLRAQVYLVPEAAATVAGAVAVAGAVDGDLPVFEFARDATVVGPQAVGIAAVAGVGAIRRIEGGDQMRLAAVASDTRSLASVAQGGGVRIKGVDAGVPQVAPVGPGTATLPPAPATETALHAAIQTELKRIGCYSQGIDGDWGRGSQAALERFHAAQTSIPEGGTTPDEATPDEATPDEATWRALLTAPEKTCKPQPAAQVTRKKPSAPRAASPSKPAAVTKKPAPAAAPAPAAQPEKKGVKCKFLLVALVCN